MRCAPQKVIGNGRTVRQHESVLAPPASW